MYVMDTYATKALPMKRRTYNACPTRPQARQGTQGSLTPHRRGSGAGLLHAPPWAEPQGLEPKQIQDGSKIRRYLNVICEIHWPHFGDATARDLTTSFSAVGPEVSFQQSSVLKLLGASLE